MLKVEDIPILNFKCNSIFSFVEVYLRMGYQSLFHVFWILNICQIDILNLFIITFYIFPSLVDAEVWEVTYILLLFKFVLYERYSISICGSEVLLFFEFINIVSFLYNIFIKFKVLLYTFLVSSQLCYLIYLILLLLLVIFEALV